MLPAHLIVEFWVAVKNELRERYRLGEDDANEAVRRYRAALDRHRAGDVVYNRDPEPVAETIALGWEKGFPPPEGWTPSASLD